MTTAEKLSDRTSLRIQSRTRDRLAQVGRMTETFDDLLNRLLDEREPDPALIASIHNGNRSCPTCGVLFRHPGVTGS